MGQVSHFSETQEEDTNTDLSQLSGDHSELSQSQIKSQKAFGTALSKQLCRDIIIYEIFHPFVYVDTNYKHEMKEFFGYFKNDPSRKNYLLYTNFGNVEKIQAIPCAHTRMIRNLRFSFTTGIFSKMCDKFKNLEYLSLSTQGKMGDGVISDFNKMKKLRILRVYCQPSRSNRAEINMRTKTPIDLPELQDLLLFGINFRYARFVAESLKINKNIENLTLNSTIPPENPLYGTGGDFDDGVLIELCQCKNLKSLIIYNYTMKEKQFKTMIQSSTWRKDIELYFNFHEVLSQEKLKELYMLQKTYPNFKWAAAK